MTVIQLLLLAILMYGRFSSSSSNVSEVLAVVIELPSFRVPVVEKFFVEELKLVLGTNETLLIGFAEVDEEYG